MTLVLAAHAAPPFNTAFFSVAATIMPVLFLAIAVQGDTYKQLTTRLDRAGDQIDEYHAAAEASPGSATLIRAGYRLLLVTLLLIPAVILIPILSIAGEITALTALYTQHNTDGTLVLAAAIFLVIAAAAPAIAKLLPADRLRRRFSHHGPAAYTPSDTGKTDAT